MTAAMGEARAGDAAGDEIARAEAYLRANAGRFRHQELDQQLRTAGYADATIAAAWSRLAPAGPLAMAQPAPGFTGLVQRLGFAFVGVVYGISVVWAAGSIPSTLENGTNGIFALIAGLYAVALVAAYRAGSKRYRRVLEQRAGLLPTVRVLAFMAVAWVSASLLALAPISLVR